VKKKFYGFFAKTLLLLLLSFSFAHAAEEKELEWVLKDTRFEFGYVAGQFIGLKQGYLDLGAFTPLFQSGDFLAFADAKGYRFDNSRWGASAGIGMRTWSMRDFIFGSNVYYDYLQGRRHSFNRMGAGLECLGACWDLRINGYFPILDTIHCSERRVFTDFQGDFIASAEHRQFMPRLGFDMELGIPIGSWDEFSCYFAAGPYYYNWRQQKNYWGGQARFELYWKSYFTAQIQTSYDAVNHSRTEGKFLVFIPFELFLDCKSSEDLCKALFYQPVVRNGTIFTEHCCRFICNWDHERHRCGCNR
jgi:hypothetical protein